MKMSETSLSMQKLNDVIEHYKRHIGRATEGNDNDKIMKCILKLSRLPITVQNLQKTGIGRVVNSLRKYDGNIGESAKSLVVQWKNVVKIEESENFYQKNENSDEEHEDVSSANDTEELQISQNITSSVASTSYYNNSSNDPGLSDENNDHSSGSCKSYNHFEKMSKYKKSKKDRESKKRKESSYTSTDEQGDEKSSKKIKKDSKYESVKIKKDSEKIKVTTSRRENDNNCEDDNKKDKKSSHSDKKKDKHKSTHKSESRSESKSHKDKHESHRDKHESKSGHRDKTDPKKKSKEKNKEVLKQESKPSASSSTSKTFEEALLGIEINKKKGKSKCRDISSRSNSSERESSPIPTSMQLAPINLDPEELIANYKPLPQLDVKKKKSLDEIDTLSTSMKTKNMRTKVYSGNKCTIYTEVPSLSEFCVRTLKDNIDELGETGGVPYLILAPVLSHATPDQLYQIENHNFYLIEDTGPLWEYHSKKEFRNTAPDKNETWRNFYIRCLEEREIKLAKLRRHINANQAASTPVRKTQLAYVDSMAKPPRGIARRQAKYHTPADAKHSILSKSMMGGHSTADALSSSNRSITMATGVPIALSSNQSASSSSALKKKKAPLMQKALQLIKSTRRR